jgi:hypothetical protein
LSDSLLSHSDEAVQEAIQAQLNDWAVTIRQAAPAHCTVQCAMCNVQWHPQVHVPRIVSGHDALAIGPSPLATPWQRLRAQPAVTVQAFARFWDADVDMTELARFYEATPPPYREGARSRLQTGLLESLTTVYTGRVMHHNQVVRPLQGIAVASPSGDL